jgi:hypothetical protein
VYVEIRDDRALVRDGDNCGSLDVRVRADDRSRVGLALRKAELGRWSGGAEAELAVAGLRAAAAAAGVAPDWPGRWDSMIDYARANGWLTADGAYLRAHLIDLGDG